ncbi:cyclic nucleotide-binding domain-containing protein [Rubrobacter marinus]|uniref:histidine kinase n=1 Tax=Rubrobacter marinus TaxID=2653852 RepID=A0A6G8PYK5_9ACTN|nr:ATP-binding protein [Rubrobacter marinus]QIN79292.1 cyclic nucleotide-binding domain-containing protein [Rubrobacter marinus]
MIHDPQDTSVFPKLADEEVAWLSAHGDELKLEAGEYLFLENESVDSFFVLLEGELRVLRPVEGGDEEVATHLPGEFTGQLAVLAGNVPRFRVRAVAPSRLLEITSGAFRRVSAERPAVADVFISALSRRVRENQDWARQNEKLAALGKLSAGLAHELNNPASAARRAAASLRTVILDAQETALRHDGRFTDGEKERILALRREVAGAGVDAVPLDGLERSDLEDELSEKLEERGVEEAWELGPTLAGAGLDAERIEAFADGMEGEKLAGALAWLATTLDLLGLAGEVEGSTGRISELVRAMKEYTYMDRAPMQEVDVHEGIESTLVILGHKLKGNVEVEREYDRGLPRVSARGGELNQVWTNLIDNALDAMSGGEGMGHLKIKTSRDGGCVKVEITDDGPGIARGLKGRIFEPFFTTKPIGEGTGLGLDIARRIVTRRHGGDMRVDSKPGETRFSVRLPVGAGEKDGG